MKDDKFNAGSEHVNITLCGVPMNNGFDWTVSAVNADKLTGDDWDDIGYYIQWLKGDG